MVRAEIERNRGNPARAVQLLETVKRFDLSVIAGYWNNYIRGLAYLQQRSGGEAAAEFQKILDHRGVDMLSSLYPLAHLGLARAAAQSGDTSKSKQKYQDFFALWKDADSDVPILIEARKEYAALK
jgi:hypothetical protein